MLDARVSADNHAQWGEGSKRPCRTPLPYKDLAAGTAKWRQGAAVDNSLVHWNWPGRSCGATCGFPKADGASPSAHMGGKGGGHAL